MTSSASAPVADWADFDWFIGTYIPKQVVPVLRTFVQIVEHGTGTYLGVRQGDRKADVIFKLTNSFTAMKNTGQHELYSRLRRQCETQGAPLPNPYRDQPRPGPTFGGSTFNASRYGSTSSSAYRTPPAGPSRPAAGQSSSWGQTSGHSTLYGAASRGVIMQDWKPNALWKPIKALTPLETLPDITASESSHAKRERKTHFVMPADVVEKLQQSKANPAAVPQYQVRLFCTSSDHYRPPGMPVPPGGVHLNNLNLPIEYPSVPEVHVDEYPLSFRERGLRGKAGSAPPFDLDRSSKGLVLQPGRMTSVAFGHMGPTTGKKKDQSKRFYYQVLLVEWTPKEALLRRLETKAPTPAAESLAMVTKLREEDDDDDIIVGTSKMGLKDPLSYMRITRPIRSKHCRHLQCFDARWWIESNATHPQWHCPCCSKTLQFDDLIVDGFFLDILNAVPEEEEEVLLEPGHEWHTEDGKYGSKSWFDKNPPGSGAPAAGNGQELPTPAATERSEARKDPSPARSESPDTKGKRKAIEVLSSDDENERPAQRASTAGARAQTQPLAPGSARPSAGPSGSPASARQPARNAAVIDLTLSSDEEDEDDDDDDPDDQGASPLSHGYRSARIGGSDRVIAEALGFDRPPTPPLPGQLGSGAFARSQSDGRLSAVTNQRSVSGGSAGSTSYNAPARAASATGFGLSAARYDPNSGSANGGGLARWDDHLRPSLPASSSGRPGMASAPPSSTAVAGANGSTRLQPPAPSLRDRISPAYELEQFIDSQMRRGGHDSDETEDEDEPERTARRKDLERALADAASW